MFKYHVVDFWLLLRLHPLASGLCRAGYKFKSLEIIVDNEQGLIVERTIALRPYPALKLFRDAMYASLKDKLPPDVWDYP